MPSPKARLNRAPISFSTRKQKVPPLITKKPLVVINVIYFLDQFAIRQMIQFRIVLERRKKDVETKVEFTLKISG